MQKRKGDIPSISRVGATVKTILMRSISLILGCLNFYLLAFASKSLASSVIMLLSISYVSLPLIVYGLGGNVALSRISLLKGFAAPMTKEHFRNMRLAHAEKNATRT